MTPGIYESPWLTDELRMFRASVREFVERELVPRQPAWREQHHPDPESWLAAGAVGLLLPDVPGEYGGGDGSFCHEAVVLEELARAGVPFGSNVQSTVAHYILDCGNEDQKRAWLPRMASGELVSAIAMTEAHAGSDLQAIRTVASRDGDFYVVNGSKTFITNGWQAGLVCLAVKTDPKAKGPRSLSLLMVETRDLPGYRTGRPLEKVGRNGQDTTELFFDDVRVPAANLLGGGPGTGLAQMMDQLPYERLSIGVGAVATAEKAVEITTRYAKERRAFGQALIELQHVRFKLAECRTEAHVGRVFLDSCIERFAAGRLDAVTAAMAKYWLTDAQCRIVDECLQLHGGYGYMQEYEIARMWADSRAQRIYAGTNEIMKEVVGWAL